MAIDKSPCWDIKVRSNFTNDTLRAALTNKTCDEVIILAHGNRPNVNNPSGITTYTRADTNGVGGPPVDFNQLQNRQGGGPACTFNTCFGENIADAATNAGIPSRGFPGSRNNPETLVSDLASATINRMNEIARTDCCEQDGNKTLCVLIGPEITQYR